MRLIKPAKIGHKDFILILLPVFIWGAAYLSRPYVLKTPCQGNLQLCSPADLPGIDRVVVPMDSADANRWSTWTQNAAGVVAFTGPVAFHLRSLAIAAISPAAAGVAILADLIILLETTLWNGAIMETFRISIQRPRPYVYRDPIGKAGDGSHYTSFYSGHTSFAAAILTAFILILLSRGASVGWVTAFTLFGVALTFLTGSLRVLAGKHFISDVLFAIFAGCLVAVLVSIVHRPKRTTISQ